MKQRLIEALATKFGVDAKMVEGIAEKLSKTVTKEEEVATAVEGVTFLQVLESYADKRANDASVTARKNAIKQYETQYGLKEGKPIEEPVPPTPPTPPVQTPPAPPTPPTPPTPPKTEKKEEEVPDYIKKILEQNQALAGTVKTLSDKVAGFEKKDLATARRERLNSVIAKLTESQRKPYARISLDEMKDDEFDTFLEDVKTDAEAMVKENDAAKAALDAASHRPGVGNFVVSGKASKNELDDVMKSIH